jgi:hypothetical protein
MYGRMMCNEDGFHKELLAGLSVGKKSDADVLEVGLVAYFDTATDGRLRLRRLID